jgi:transposase
MMRDFLGIELSLGSVSNIEQQVSEALADPVAEAGEYVRHSAAVNADETSWREDKKKAWLWLAASSLITVFVVATGRGARVAKDLLGDAFDGVLTTDRWAGYNWVDVTRRQICWAHLKRDFQSWVDGGDAGARLGRLMLVQVRRMFRLWHHVRDGTLSREQFIKKMRPVQLEIATLLTEASTCKTPRVRGMAKQMLKLEGALWTFVDTPSIEPTNNFGERQIRHAVIWRKGSFGTESAAGSRFVERMLTTIATLRQQRRNVPEFIADACRAQLTGAAKPSLIPQRPAAIAAAA